MTKTSLICGSIAFDKIMQYHGRFGDTLLADQLHRVNVSFLVPTLRTEFGGCAVNIAYNLKLLGGEPLIMGTIGQDGGDYLERMDKQGLATNAIRTIDRRLHRPVLRHGRPGQQPDQRLPPGRDAVLAREQPGRPPAAARGDHLAGRPRRHDQARARLRGAAACPSSSIRASSCRCSAAKSC